MVVQHQLEAGEIEQRVARLGILLEQCLEFRDRLLPLPLLRVGYGQVVTRLQIMRRERKRVAEIGFGGGAVPLTGGEDAAVVERVGEVGREGQRAIEAALRPRQVTLSELQIAEIVPPSLKPGASCVASRKKRAASGGLLSVASTPRRFSASGKWGRRSKDRRAAAVAAERSPSLRRTSARL